MSFDEETLRQWYVKDLTLMIEWVKGLPLMDHKDFLLNDKVCCSVYHILL